ncbi:MAG: hypothetical protein UV68_C0041G0008 [Candidatus Collierbacteria bacterium GW2011_GWC2_43_12]|uniref:Uncharacterized protein n=1 Tax=Candidatus Collierbacteria bacterium GW2011_GWC2_43_12 TaxID=1618390 RepID=A0A0G1FBZ3_9BACT|nr:MAG: hypothetical protein UV68_C0041G0008 [Candidatus Collierbacteria bacterium GW2011_GWC2_43_12]
MTTKETRLFNIISVGGILVLVMIIGLTIFKYVPRLLPYEKKRVLSEDVKYCLTKIGSGDLIRVLEMGGEVYPMAEFGKDLSDCMKTKATSAKTVGPTIQANY